MSTLAIARAYLQPPGAAWRWGSDGEFLEWIGGHTITHRQAFGQFLAPLVEQGWPDPTDVVLAINALSHPNRESLARIPAEHWMVKDLPELIEQAQALAYKGVTTQVAFTALFEGRPPVLSMEQSRWLMALISQGWDPNTLPAEAALLQPLGDPNAPRTRPIDLALRLETSLDELPDPVDLKLSMAERVGRLLDQVQEDPELAGLARVSRDLVAAVHLPKVVSDPQDLPLGGYSDISNKGEIDRLLVSELAYDDLTLATRVALKEALYLRRESPPAPQPQICHVLLDVGLRCWGLPRLFGTGVALALALRSDSQRSLSFYHSDAGEAAGVSLDDKAGLKQHLRQLDTAGSPQKTLAHLREANAEEDLLFITEEEVLDDCESAVLRLAREGGALYVATVHRSGRFQLWAFGPQGKRPLQSATIDLDVLNHPDLSSDSVKGDGSLPAYFLCTPAPLRLPHMINRKHRACHPELGLLMVNKRKHLLFWKGDANYPLHLGRLKLCAMVLGCWIDPESGNGIIITSHRSNGTTSNTFHYFDAQENRITVHPTNLSVHGFRHGLVMAGRLVMVFKDRIECRSRFTGALLGETRIKVKHTDFVGEFCRPVCAGANWSRLVINEHQPSTIEVPQTKVYVLVCARPGHQELIGISKAGRIVQLFPKKVLGSIPEKFLPTLNYSLLSTDGSALRLDNRSWMDLKRMEIVLCPTVGELEDERFPLRNQIRNRFVSIGRAPGNRLVLKTPNGGRRALLRHSDGRLTWTDNTTTFESEQRFEKVTGQDDDILQMAEWPDGSRAWLDKRGALHLRSADTTQAELSISLTEKAVAAWSSDGKRAGEPQLLAKSVNADANDVLDALRAFVGRLP